MVSRDVNSQESRPPTLEDLVQLCSIEYAVASKQILRMSVQGIEIPFANIDLMMELKRSIRPKDQMDLEYLKALKLSSQK